MLSMIVGEDCLDISWGVDVDVDVHIDEFFNAIFLWLPLDVNLVKLLWFKHRVQSNPRLNLDVDIILIEAVDLVMAPLELDLQEQPQRIQQALVLNLYLVGVQLRMENRFNLIGFH